MLRRAPLPNPLITSSSNLVLKDLLNLCDKHPKDTAVQVVMTAVRFLSTSVICTNNQKDFLLSALLEGLTQYLNETGNNHFLEGLSIITNPSIDLIDSTLLKPISETICYSLKKHSLANPNCLVPLMNSKPEAYPLPVPEDMFFKITEYFKTDKLALASLRCVSRFFARSPLTQKEKEERKESPIWPGMACNIVSCDFLGKAIFISNPLGQSFAWGNHITKLFHTIPPEYNRRCKPTSLTLLMGKQIKKIVTNPEAIFIQSVSGAWLACGDNREGRLGLGHQVKIYAPIMLSFPASFHPSLTEDQTRFVNSLIDIVISQKPITIADFLGRLFFAYAEQSQKPRTMIDFLGGLFFSAEQSKDDFLDKATAREIAFTLLSQQLNYSDCVRLIQQSGLLEAAAKTINDKGDSLDLLCVCKKLYDKNFPQQVETILSTTKNSRMHHSR